MKLNHPCRKDCPLRTAECKKTCPDWAKFEAAKAEDYAQRAKDFELKDAQIEMDRRRARMHAEGKWRSGSR